MRDPDKLKSAAMRAVLSRPDLLSYEFNDSGNAQRLIAIYGKSMLYCYPLKKWLVWDGRRWAADVTGRSDKFSKEAMVEFLRQAIDAGNEIAEKFARRSLNLRGIRSLLSLSECEILVRPDELDTNPDLLNFENGTVNLRTREKKAHDPADRITKLIHYDYDPQADCPRWLGFLDEIMGGGPDAGEGELARTERLIEYLKRALGYSLTGHTSEKAVFVPFGAATTKKHHAEHGVQAGRGVFRSIAGGQPNGKTGVK